MDEEQNEPNAPLNADDFVDRPPNREECRRLLDEANGYLIRIRSWNHLRSRFHKSHPDWKPDLSDSADPWEAKRIVLSLEVEGKREAVDLHAAQLDHADLREAHLEEVRLNKASLRVAQLDGAHLEKAHLYGADLRSAVLQAHFEGADLSAAKMQGAGLHLAQLQGANLCDANLEDAYMSDTHLEGAILVRAKLMRADMAGARLEKADLTQARLDSAELDLLDLRKAVLRGTDFGLLPKSRLIEWFCGDRPGVVNQYSLCWLYIRLNWFQICQVRVVRSVVERFISGSYVVGCLNSSHPTIILDGADIRMCRGFIPNGQSVNGTIFSPNAIDPYSIVRRKYTGPLMLFNLVFLAVFFTPYIIRAGAWTAYDRAQRTEIGQVYITEGPGAVRRALWEQSLDSVGIHGAIESAQADLRAQVPPAFIEHLVAWEAARALEVMESAPDTEREHIVQADNIETRERSVLMIVLGFEPGFFGTLAGCLSIVFVLYNVLRGVVTWWLSQVRDAEERSGHLPDIRQYWWCYSLHHYFLRYVYWFAVGAFMLNMSRWALSTVSVPI